MTKLKSLLLLASRLESAKKEEVTKSGIIIPIGITTVSNVPLRGRVEHIGPGLPGIPMEVKVGDIVLYKRDAITTEVDGMDLLEQGMLIQIESEEEFQPTHTEKHIASFERYPWTLPSEGPEGGYPLTPDECFKSESEE